MNARMAGQLAAAMVVAALLGGCAVTPVENPQAIATSQYNAAYEASLLALRDQGFELDRQDHRYGVITTRPLVAPTAAEVWHGSNTTAAQAISSTTNYQRRIARVFLKPAAPDAPEAAAYDVHVEVAIERRQQPTRVVTHSVSQRRLASTLDGVPHEWKKRGIPGQYWMFVGRDGQLESRLMKDIFHRLGSAGQEMEAAKDE